MESVVAIGTWLYDGTVPTTVLVVMLDFDFWYAMGAADGDLEPWERATLNREGHLYYVRYRPGYPHDGEPFWPDSVGFPSLAEAVAAAEAAVPGPVTWQ
jgi:hypothetical protein